MTPDEVAILVVCYNAGALLERCLASVVAAEDCDGARIGRIVVVDNASTDGAAEGVEGRFPGVDLVRSEKNLGFAGGNVLGWDHVCRVAPDVSYVYLLNQDAVVAPDFLGPLVSWMRDHPGTATAQSLLLLDDDREKVNSLGNRSHYLGFGFVTGLSETARDDLKPAAVDYTSGAAVLVRASVVEQVGLFEPEMFMYLEDADLSWKARQIGLENVMVPASRAYHQYEPGVPMHHYYYLERNRGWLLLVYYRSETLLLLCPALVLMEMVQVGFALMHGHLREKLGSWGYFLRSQRLRRILALRRAVQARRTIDDRAFLGNFAGRIEYPTLTSPLLRYVVNPLFAAYWFVARRLIRW
ncbi:MAG: hypothetical protein CMJ18_09305 [Phycisphaeraceae bacterium]|nr:hypothetical protein [Phycisphaeraceae bacterium]